LPLIQIVLFQLGAFGRQPLKVLYLGPPQYHLLRAGLHCIRKMCNGIRRWDVWYAWKRQASIREVGGWRVGL
jgi:hypothetical protein